MKRITYQIDSFTREKFKGNPAGVIINADGLSDEQMQRIARELNNSESARIQLPATPMGRWGGTWSKTGSLRRRVIISNSTADRGRPSSAPARFTSG